MNGRRKGLARHLLLVPVVLLALGLRAYDLDYGLPGILHPDEPKVLQPALRIADVSDFSLDPGFFNYPALQMYVLAAAFLVDGAVATDGSLAAPRLPGSEEAALIGRWVTTLFGVATVLAVYAAGLLVGGRVTALLAALFLAVAPFHALDSHYANVDVPLAFWCVLAFLFLQRWLDSHRLRDFLLGAASIGLAGATKYNGLCLVLLLTATVLLHDRPATGRFARLRLIGLGTAVAAGVFLLCAPYTLLRLESVVQALGFEQRHVRGGHWGWDLNTGGLIYRPLLYHFAAGFPFVLGFALYGLCIGGAADLLRRARRTWIPLAFAFASVFLPVGLSRVVFPRYLVPSIPFLVIVAAHFAATIVGRRNRPAVRAAGIVVVAAALAYTAAVTVTQLRALTPQTADQASRWIEENVPPGSEIAVATIVDTLSFAEERYDVSRFRMVRALVSDYGPEWLVVSGWYDLSLQRGRLRFTPEARFLRDLGSPGSAYERMVGFEARYLTEDLYGLLDPYFKNQFESPDMTIYRRRR